MSAAIPAGKYADPGAWRHAIAKSDLSPSTRHVAHAFALFIPRGHRSSFVGVRRLAAATGYATNTVLKALAELRDGGWIVEEPTVKGGKVKRYPTVPTVSTTETPTVSTTETLSDDETVSMADEGVSMAEQTVSMAEQTVSVTETYLKDNSELTQIRTPPRCFCQKKNCGRKVQHNREYTADPSAFLAKHLGASMEMPERIEGNGKDIA